MVEFLPQIRLLVGCERAANLRQHLRRRDRARPLVGVGHQVRQALTLVSVGTVRRRLRHNHSMRLASGSRQGHRSGCRPAPAARPARPARRAGRAAAATLWGCGCRGCRRSPWRCATRAGAFGGAAQLGDKRRHSGAARRPSASAKSSVPTRQSTSPKPYCLSFCRAPGPAAARTCQPATRPASGSGAGRPRPRLAGTGPPAQAGPAGLGAGQILWEQVVGQGRIRDQVGCGWRQRCCGGPKQCLHLTRFLPIPAGRAPCGSAPSGAACRQTRRGAARS
jgi:hypothetical protein